MSTLPTIPVSSLRNAKDLDHYTLGAYDTTEPWQLRIVVIVPGLPGPSWVGRSRRQVTHSRKALALALPNLDALTLEMAQTHTNVITDYFGVREFARKDRARGKVLPGASVRPPWVPSEQPNFTH